MIAPTAESVRPSRRPDSRCHRSAGDWMFDSLAHLALYAEGDGGNFRAHARVHDGPEKFVIRASERAQPQRFCPHRGAFPPETSRAPAQSASTMTARFTGRLRTSIDSFEDDYNLPRRQLPTSKSALPKCSGPRAAKKLSSWENLLPRRENLALRQYFRRKSRLPPDVSENIHPHRALPQETAPETARDVVFAESPGHPLAQAVRSALNAGLRAMNNELSSPPCCATSAFSLSGPTAQTRSSKIDQHRTAVWREAASTGGKLPRETPGPSAISDGFAASGDEHCRGHGQQETSIKMTTSCGETPCHCGFQCSQRKSP